MYNDLYEQTEPILAFKVYATQEVTRNMKSGQLLSMSFDVDSNSIMVLNQGDKIGHVPKDEKEIHEFCLQNLWQYLIVISVPIHASSGIRVIPQTFCN
jgi:hypothetical protein